MADNIKITYHFKCNDDIYMIIENWAEKYGIIEDKFPKQLGSDDLTYCYSLNENNQKTLLTINILDGIVYIETWIMASISREELSKKHISELLEKLKN